METNLKHKGEAQPEKLIAHAGTGSTDAVEETQNLSRHLLPLPGLAEIRC